MSELSTRYAVDLPAPCSPLATKISKQKPGRRAASRKARINSPAVLIGAEEGPLSDPELNDVE